MPVVISAAVAFVAMIYVVIYYYLRIGVVARKAFADNASEYMPVEDLPEVSVIVYAYDDADFLRRLLPQLLGQDYPAPYEVIVVNEGQSDATSEVVNLLAMKHHNLYLTFTPDGARNLSRKKLALTLGIKAARYGVVATVDADTSVNSDKWLIRMAGHFSDPRCEVVIGATRPDDQSDDMSGRVFRTFDYCADSVTYISSAIAGRPYRGTSHNLAYRRQLFFDNKGFSRSLNLRYGDDDVFVSEIANGKNTVVELSEESVTTSLSYNPRRAYREFKQKVLFTGSFVRKGARRMMAVCSVAVWIWFAAAIVMVWCGYPSLLPVCVAVGTGLGLWIPVVCIWRKVRAALGFKPLAWSLPVLVLSRPVHTFVAKVRSSKNKVHNYTWG